MAIDIKDTTDKIIAIISKKLDVESSTIETDSTLQDLGADSIDMVEIIMNIEEDFSIEINDEAVEKLHHLQDLISYVHALRIK